MKTSDSEIDPQEAYRVAMGFLTAVYNKDHTGIVVVCQNLPHEGYLGAAIGALCNMLLAALPTDNISEALKNIALAIEDMKWPEG